MKIKVWVLTVLFACFVEAVLAEEMEPTPEISAPNNSHSNSGFFMGAGAAYNHMTACIKTSVSNCDTVYTSYSQNPANLRLLAGYAFGKHLAVEAEYSNLGSFEVQNTVGTVVGNVKANTISVAAKGTITFPHGWSIFGKAGLASTRMQYSAKPGWVLMMASNQTSGGLILGAGGQYDFNSTMSIRLWTDGTTYNGSGYSGMIGGTSIEGIYRF